MNAVIKKLRWGVVFFILLALALYSANTNAGQIVDAYPQYLEEKNFQRISEYFTDKEKSGRRLIMRTQADVRTGNYFIITLDKKARDLPAGTQLKIEVIASHSNTLQAFTLSLPSEKPNTREIFAGITGSDWLHAKAEVRAWKITILDETGKPVAEKQSYLWALP